MFVDPVSAQEIARQRIELRIAHGARHRRLQSELGMSIGWRPGLAGALRAMADRIDAYEPPRPAIDQR